MSEEKKTTVSENRRQVILEDKYCDMAERIGDGNRSKGIRIALELYEELIKSANTNNSDTAINIP